MPPLIRLIQPSDNPHIAKIIRDTLTEFGANRPGTAWADAATDTLFEVFREERSVYNIVESDGKIIGGGGLYPTTGLPEDTCELVKMYLVPEARGTGLGKQLIFHCLDQARELGFSNVYLETMPELSKALKLYEKLGFSYLPGPMGNSGHFSCPIWMVMKLSFDTTQ